MVSFGLWCQLLSDFVELLFQFFVGDVAIIICVQVVDKSVDFVVGEVLLVTCHDTSGFLLQCYQCLGGIGSVSSR